MLDPSIIKSKAKEHKLRVIDFRRHLHAHPELSFEEEQTAAYIRSILTEHGIPFQVMANTGTVAEIRGENPSKKVVALRADIDALPIQEQNEKPYRSQYEGKMHACGHDVHASCALGAALLLQELKNQWEGTVKILFQPGEEKAPGGASLMIKEGALKNPTPVSIIGQHVAPQIPVGKVGFRPGIYMASADEIYMKIRGKGGHAAMPDSNIDPVVIASHIIIALQQVVSRMANPKIPTVLSIGKVIAQGATNVIPNEVYIEGTFRTMNETWRSEAKTKIKKMAESIAEGMGATCEFWVMDGYPYLENHPELTELMRQGAVEYLGEAQVLPLDLWMASEDFAFYTHQIDACFYRLGVRNEAKGIQSSVHTPTFDIDEDALEIGTGLMTWLALKQLKEYK